jgi:hypothetical protein
MNKSGMTMAEVAIAALIIGLAVGPMFVLTSSTNRMSKISGYEIMACHYANEIADQLHRYSNYFPQLISEAKIATSNSNTDLSHFLRDQTFLEKVSEVNDQPIWVPFQTNGKEFGLSLYLSPLNARFSQRTIEVDIVNDSASQVLKNDNDKKYYRVTIRLVWRIPGVKGNRDFNYSKVIFLSD